MEPKGSSPHKDPPLVHAQTICDVSLTSCYFKISFISFSHLQLGLQNSLFPSDFPTKILCAIIIEDLAELNQNTRAYALHDITRPSRQSCDKLSRCIAKCLLITPSSNEICPEVKLCDIDVFFALITYLKSVLRDHLNVPRDRHI